MSNQAIFCFEPFESAGSILAFAESTFSPAAEKEGTQFNRSKNDIQAIREATFITFLRRLRPKGRESKPQLATSLNCFGHIVLPSLEPIKRKTYE